MFNLKNLSFNISPEEPKEEMMVRSEENGDLLEDNHSERDGFAVPFTVSFPSNLADKREDLKVAID